MTLASAQFLMTLHSSVMNVSIATVAKDVGTTVTGIQLAITLYTLVMATFMITGGKVGQLLGRKRAVLIGVLTTTFLGSVAANSAIPEELSAQARSSRHRASLRERRPSRCRARQGRRPAGDPPGHRRREPSSMINGLRVALGVLALIALAALLLTRRLPTAQSGSAVALEEGTPDDAPQKGGQP